MTAYYPDYDYAAGDIEGAGDGGPGLAGWAVAPGAADDPAPVDQPTTDNTKNDDNVTISDDPNAPPPEAPTNMGGDWILTPAGGHPKEDWADQGDIVSGSYSTYMGNQPNLGLIGKAGDPSVDTVDTAYQVALEKIGDPALAEAALMEAYKQDLDPNALTSEQLANLIDEDSRYMQLAKREALEAANARGLANSSLAVGASHDAAIRAAMPIAQSDAQAYLQQSLANQQYENAARSQNSQLQTQVNLANADAKNQFRIQDFQAHLQQQLMQQEHIYAKEDMANQYRYSLALANADWENRANYMIAEYGQKFGIQQLIEDSKMNRLKVENKFKQKVIDQQTWLAFNMMESSNLAGLTNVLTQIDTDPNLSEEERERARNAAIDDYNNMGTINAEIWGDDPKYFDKDWANNGKVVVDEDGNVSYEKGPPSKLYPNGPPNPPGDTGDGDTGDGGDTGDDGDAGDDEDETPWYDPDKDGDPGQGDGGDTGQGW